jgi:ubiquinone/menaquinone biosynthesis C-methylase UbiE
MNRQPEKEVMDGSAEAAAYAAADFSAVNDAFADRLIDLSGNVQAAVAVDLGAGPGDIALRIWRRRPGWRIVAVDGSAAMLRLAKEAIDKAGAGRWIDLLEADALASGLAGGTFDIVYSNSLLHHIRDPLALWRSMAALPKPGGLLFLRDLCRPATGEQARQIVQNYAGGESELLQKEFFDSLLAAYTVEEVRSQLTSAGLGRLSVAMSSDRHLDVWGQMGGV